MAYVKTSSKKKQQTILGIVLGVICIGLIVFLIVNGVSGKNAETAVDLTDQDAKVTVTLANGSVIGFGSDDEGDATTVKTTAAATEAQSRSSIFDTTAAADTTTTKAAAATDSNCPSFVADAFAQNGANATYAISHKYCIAVNTRQNIVIVYERASDGTFTKPVKAMIASCGKSESPTKLGTFKTTDKYTWRALNGGVYGQYATRISGSYLFHSVPYYSQDPSKLETDEYNHLGENRSLGCVRLAVKDCKWIYDNCPSGTIVTLYDKAGTREPLARPSSIHIDPSSPNAGWDPTDPNPNNPWNK